VAIADIWFLDGKLESDFEPANIHHLMDVGDGATKVVTETRILATDATAQRRFGWYWRLVYPGSMIIRVMWLRAIKRRAETGA
jgi:hypothetical protein